MDIDIDNLKLRAKEGEVCAQIDLAHAYLNGDGVARNRKHYMTWLIKAAENGDLASQMELINILRDRRSKYSNPESALHWMKIAQQNGASFTKEELAKVGDPDVCYELVNELLFDESKHDFKKAKKLLLLYNPTKDVILDFAKEYHARYVDNKRECSNISYLYMLSCKGDAEEINKMAVDLLSSNEIGNLNIAFTLFYEAHRLGNGCATASYLYCLIYGKGTRKNLQEAIDVYYQGKKRNVSFTHCFSTGKKIGKPFNLPTDSEWNRLCAKYKTKSAASGLVDKLSNFFRALIEIPNSFWKKKASLAIKAEKEEISRALAKGDIEAAEGCRYEGCIQNYHRFGFVVLLFIFIISIIAAIISGITIGHIPNCLTYTIITSLFLPSFALFVEIDQVISKIIALTFLLIIAGFGVYYLTVVLNWGEMISELSFVSIILYLVLFICLLYVAIWIFLMSYLLIPVGIWWDYLISVEYAKGKWAAIIYAILSLSIIIGAGYWLFCNGYIF